MLKIFLTIDPETHRGLYDNESKFLGVFQSMQEAQAVLGDTLSFCSIRSGA